MVPGLRPDLGSPGRGRARALGGDARLKVLELVIGIAFTLGGVRSIWYWSRRHFEGTDVVDHLLYALYLTGRIGLWFAFAGFFFIYASIDVQGRAALDELETYRWYVLVPLILGVMQLIGGWFLGRRSPEGERETGREA